MHRTSMKYILGLAAFVVATYPGSARSTTGECRRTLIAAYQTYARHTIHTLQKCEDKIVRGAPGYPVGLDCRTDPATMANIEFDKNHFAHKVRSACGGKNKVCNAGDTGDDADVPLAAIGWDIGTCPDFEGRGCTNAIADCNDIGVCIFCMADATQSQALSLYYGAFNVPASDRGLENCQREIGKRAVEFFRSKVKILETCERKVFAGDMPGPCPDTVAEQRITKADQRAHDKICEKCGGIDKRCGGAPDRTTSEIGFTSTCPNVTIPGGPSCAGSIATLDDIVKCADCVTEFKVDCLDAVSVPELKAYPAECNATP